jgi:signal transduction histidine kinase/HAMP domain-containing protein
MTIRKKLGMGIGILLILFLALGTITSFQTGQIGENLTEIIQGKELGKQIAVLHQQYKALDETLKDKQNSQKALYAETVKKFEKIPDIIKQKLCSGIDLNGQDGYEKMLGTSKIEASISLIATWLGIHLQSPDKDYKKLIFDNIAIVENELERFKNFYLTEQEREGVEELQNILSQIVPNITEILVVNDYLQTNTYEHKNKRAQIDEILDEEFEIFSRSDLEHAKQSGQKMVQTAVTVTLILVLTGFIDVFVFSAAITNTITTPITKLKNAITEIGRGNFDTKIEFESEDEIGQLADCFNKMTEDLKETTTSVAELNKEISMRKKAQDSLQKARNDLELRVEQRTAELAQANKELESEIAERKRAEEELEALNRGLDSAVRDLSRSNKELQEFAYIAAHDLKAPLRAIATLADWISTDCAQNLDEQGKKQVGMLIDKVKQMSALIDGILKYSSAAGNSEQGRQEVDLNAVISEITEEINPPENIEIKIDDELPTLKCDKTHIVQIFQNLLTNAIKFMDKPDGRIRIGFTQQDDIWKFSVSDNGPGIDDKYFDKIFKMFQTLSQKDECEGSGIGLAIVKKIVELNNGKVWVESESGRGCTFFFTLPRQEYLCSV